MLSVCPDWNLGRKCPLTQIFGVLVYLRLGQVQRPRFTVTTTTTTILRPFFRDHPGEPVPEENFWNLQCKGRLTEADTPTIRLGATPAGLTSAHLHHPPSKFTVTRKNVKSIYCDLE